MIVAGNPVADNPPKVEAVDVLVKGFISQWVSENPPPRWWEFWKRPNLVKVVKFLLAAVDELILAVQKEIASGPEKKAIVLAACSVIYDFVADHALPIWAKPWATKVKDFVILIVIASAIDWIVAKYKDGSWSIPSSSSSSSSSTTQELKNVQKAKRKKRGNQGK